MNRPRRAWIGIGLLLPATLGSAVGCHQTPRSNVPPPVQYSNGWNGSAPQGGAWNNNHVAPGNANMNGGVWSGSNPNSGMTPNSWQNGGGVPMSSNSSSTNAKAGLVSNRDANNPVVDPNVKAASFSAEQFQPKLPDFADSPSSNDNGKSDPIAPSDPVPSFTPPDAGSSVSGLE